MHIEEEHVAVVSSVRGHAARELKGLAVGRFAVGDVDDDGWKIARMQIDPRPHDLRGEVEGLAHRRAILRMRIEPDRKFSALCDDLAVAADLLEALLHPQRPLGQVADGDEILVDVVDRTDEGLNTIPIADDSDVEVVADTILFGTSEDEVLQETVDDIGQHTRLAWRRVPSLLGPAERILH